MNGSIRFNPDVNIEVDVDPSAEEGARLVSAKNLVDGQELGIGGGSELPEVTSADEGKVLAVNASGEWAASTNGLIQLTDTGIDVSYNDLLTMINAGIIPHFIVITEGESTSIVINKLDNLIEAEGIYYASFINYNTLGEVWEVVPFAASDANTPMLPD